jgi:hypothetical protein
MLAKIIGWILMVIILTPSGGKAEPMLQEITQYLW